MLKKSLCFSSVGFALAMAMVICSVSTTSCTKTNTITKTDTVTKTDSILVPEKDTLVTTAILTANSWEAIYDRAMVGGEMLFYMRGATSGNTMDLDNEYITFNSNGSGIYTEPSGTQDSFTWSYSDSSYTKLVWIWNISPQPVTVTWENLSYHDDAIHYTEWYVRNGDTTLGSEIRTPRN